jgi:hypothetical protein
MIILRTITDGPADRHVTWTLPDEVPPGRAELVLTVDPLVPAPKRPRTSLADWADANAEHWGDRMSSEDVGGFTGRRF